MKLFVYPTGGQGPVSSNPYIGNMKKTLSKEFELINPQYKWKLPRMLVFLLNSFKAKVFVFNWVEDSAAERGGNIGALMSMLGLRIVKWRKAKIVWIFHNIHSHGGETKWTQRFRRFLFKNADLIVAHSKEAAEYAARYANCRVEFKNHPVELIDYPEWKGEVQECDFFYWSSILPYKGVLEFLSNPLCEKTGKKIKVLGKCRDSALWDRIESLSSEHIVVENRAADFSEVAAQCKKAKYVIFPYIGDSISSSGVLMDTLLMGGTPVGPRRGAFADLADVGCCITYNHINEVFEYPTDDEHRLRLDIGKVRRFINDNSWSAFGSWLYNWAKDE